MLQKKNMSIFLLTMLSITMLLAVPSSPVAALDKYELDLWYTPSHYGSTEKAVAELIKAALEATGCFEITLKSAEWATYIAQLGQMEFFLLGWWFDYPDPANYINPFVGAGTYDQGVNYTSAEMAGYIESMFLETDPVLREQAIINAQELMASDVPVVPLVTMEEQFLAYQLDMEGCVLEPSENVHYDTMNETGDTGVIIGTSDKIKNLDPADAYDYFSSNTLVQLTHGIVEMPRDTTSADPGPFLDSWSATPDGLVYNFSLIPGWQFSDGQYLNASTLKWNLDRACYIRGYPGFLLTQLMNNTGYSGGVYTNSSVSIINDTAISIKINAADATFLSRLTYTVAWPVSPLSLNDTDIGGTPGTEWPAGLGPYKINSWTTSELILGLNPYYPANMAPNNTQITINIFADASTLLTALETDTIDVAHRKFGPQERKDIKANAGLDYITYASNGIRYLIINCEAITDVYIRRAIAAAVNRDMIKSLVWEDTVFKLFSMVPIGWFGHIDAFEDGPIQAHVEGNMTLAGYCVPDTVTATVTGTQTQTQTQTVISTIQVPGFEILAVLTMLAAIGLVYTLKKKKKI
ncbi:MAG: ABC transporter substrate-binding protein [Candidatus Hermodarchaeota archaeon]